MSDYTPTEEEVREAFAEYTVDESQHAPWRCEEIRQERRAEFDRFIASVKAEAFEEGADAGWSDFPEESVNPYRIEKGASDE